MSEDAAKQDWTAAAVEAAVAAQGVALKPGRAEKMAAAMNGPVHTDRLRASLPFDAVPSGFSEVFERCRTR
jgi:hypothetical protein